jgi:hypothetical protein
MNKKALELKREYYREWRKKNKEKTKAYQDRYWEKKASEVNKNEEV